MQTAIRVLGRLVAVRLRPHQFRMLAKGVLGLAEVGE